MRAAASDRFLGMVRIAPMSRRQASVSSVSRGTGRPVMTCKRNKTTCKRNKTVRIDPGHTGAVTKLGSLTLFRFPRHPLNQQRCSRDYCRFMEWESLGPEPARRRNLLARTPMRQRRQAIGASMLASALASMLSAAAPSPAAARPVQVPAVADDDANTCKHTP